MTPLKIKASSSLEVQLQGAVPIKGNTKVVHVVAGWPVMGDGLNNTGTGEDPCGKPSRDSSVTSNPLYSIHCCEGLQSFRCRKSME